MSDFNSEKNRIVWADVPVSNLDRAAGFYSAVLGLKVHREKFGNTAFCVLDHHDGNGGCLVLKEGEVSAERGILVYFNVNGRIREATRLAGERGGSVREPVTGIGPHGFRAIVVDSEGNRIALHSNTDA